MNAGIRNQNSQNCFVIGHSDVFWGLGVSYHSSLKPRRERDTFYRFALPEKGRTFPIPGASFVNPSNPWKNARNFFQCLEKCRNSGAADSRVWKNHLGEGLDIPGRCA
jgi:hypothetical protein